MAARRLTRNVIALGLFEHVAKSGFLSRLSLVLRARIAPVQGFLGFRSIHRAGQALSIPIL